MLSGKNATILSRPQCDKVKAWFGVGLQQSNNTSFHIHWNENVVILTKFSSLAALEVVILTTSSAASD